MMSRRLFVCVTSILAALVAAASAAPIPESMEESAVPAYRRVTERVASAGRPTAEGLARVAAAGFRTVIDLLPPDEAVAEEPATLARLGVRHVSIPIKGTNVGWAEARRAREILDDPASGPVLVHCRSGNRVGGLYALVMALDGMTAREALDAGVRAGMTGAPLRERVEALLAEGPEAPATQPSTEAPARPR